MVRGSRGSVRMGGRLGAQDANSLLQRGAEPSLGPPCRDAVLHQDCEVFVFFSPSAEAQSAEPESSAPHLHQPSPCVRARSGPTAGAPASAPPALTCAPGPRRLHARGSCTPPARPPSQLQPVCALVCAAGLNPNDDSRAEPGKEEAGRRIQNPCT